MTAPIDRHWIVSQAAEAARSWVNNPNMPRPSCPYLMGSDEALVWRSSFERHLLEYSAAEGTEGSA